MLTRDACVEKKETIDCVGGASELTSSPPQGNSTLNSKPGPASDSSSIDSAPERNFKHESDESNLTEKPDVISLNRSVSPALSDSFLGSPPPFPSANSPLPKGFSLSSRGSSFEDSAISLEDHSETRMFHSALSLSGLGASNSSSQNATRLTLEAALLQARKRDPGKNPDLTPSSFAGSGSSSTQRITGRLPPSDDLSHQSIRPEPTHNEQRTGAHGVNSARTSSTSILIHSGIVAEHASASTRRTLSIRHVHRRPSVDSSSSTGSASSEELPARLQSEFKGESGLIGYHSSLGHGAVSVRAFSHRAHPQPKHDDEPIRNTMSRLHCRLSNLVSRNKGSCFPALFSAFCAVSLPVGCLICNSSWLVASEQGPVGKAVLVLYCYLVGIMLSSMWKAASSDPGFLPKNLDPYPDMELEQQLKTTEGDGLMKDSRSISKARVRPRWISTGDYIVPTKWCRRCRIYRPPRASHCSICDSCIEQSDHHCTFLNNCIGRKNYFPFLIFLITNSVVMLTTLCISIVHLASGMTNRGARPEAVGNYIVIVFAFILGSPVLGLLAFHGNLISNNLTTLERMRPIAIQQEENKPPRRDINIYSLRSWYSNALWILCRPTFGLSRMNSGSIIDK